MKAKSLTNAEQFNDDRIIKIAEVQRICGLSRSAIYGEMNRARFPRQVKLSKRAVGWSLNEVKSWVEAHKSGR
jgi:prophage regulatory protein